MQLETLIKTFPPYEGSALWVFFKRFQPIEGEFLIGVGNAETGKNSGWFVLTNLRLIQRDGRSNEFKEVALSEVDTYKSKGKFSPTVVFKMKSGNEITFEKVKTTVADEYLSAAISQRITV